MNRRSPPAADLPDIPAPLWSALALPASVLPGVGPTRQARLEAAGLGTVGQLVRYLPRTHQDRTRFTPAAELAPGGTALVLAQVRSVSGRRIARGGFVLRAELETEDRRLGAVWFGRGYLVGLVRPGARLLLYGPVSARAGGGIELRSPDVEQAGPEPRPEGWVPVYRVPAGQSSRGLRRIVAAAVEGYAHLIPEATPAGSRERLGLLAAPEAWRQMHLPQDARGREAARRTLVLGEILALLVGLGQRRRARLGAGRPFVYPPRGELVRRMLAGLPFTLTGAQRRVLTELEEDLARSSPMRRLIHGDVGAGKTVVAAVAGLRAVEAGRQVALLAPTALLAEQHHRTLTRLAAGLCEVGLLTAALPAAERRQMLSRLAAGDLPMVVGTHALLRPDVRWRQLGLAIVDEQQRFGVRQRDALRAKGREPDVLVLSATPIPRTLGLVLYGDMDISRLDELPAGRLPVRTFCRRPAQRGPVYDFVRAQVAAGRQAFVICPRVGEAGGAENLEDEDDDGSPAAAEAWARRLGRRMPDLALGLVHGAMPTEARQRTMARFVRGELGVLVSTSVVEVGVDVPGASVLVVEDADRFGLAQLHQLRGRVGRGEHPGYCILISRRDTERLELLTRLRDGFALAEEDLRRRGPGTALGLRQHGLPELALARPGEDQDLWEQARHDARRILEDDPQLRRPEHAGLREMVQALVGRADVEEGIPGG